MAQLPDPPALPKGFHFSQGSLQAYQDCPRRFELKYIQQRAWPALITEPALEAERRMLQGAAFHRLVQQQLAGVESGLIESMLLDPQAAPPDSDLITWWQTFINQHPAEIPGDRYVEYPLTAWVSGCRLVSKLDLLVIQRTGNRGENTRAVILDWKTSRPIKRDRLIGSLQTRVYRCLAAKSLAFLNGGLAIKPENVEMVYWFAEPGTEPVHLTYNQELYQMDLDFVGGLMAEITCLRPGEFRQAAGVKPCERCVYRSLCDRGVQAGSLGEDDDFLSSGELSLEDVEEIAF